MDNVNDLNSYNYFIDRTIYYATFPIQEQAPKGYWDFKLKAVYCVGILGFTFEEKSKPGQGDVVHTVQLKDHKNKLFYEKLKFVYLEMPHFVKKEHELETRLDKWLYFIKNLENFESIPEIFKDTVFTLAFEKAEIAKYSKEELYNYEQSLKIYRDLKNVIDSAFEEGEAKGKREEKIDTAKLGKLMGLPVADIAKLTGLSEDEINSL